MRIAFLAGYLSRRSSGVRLVVEELSQALAQRGHDVRVFGMDDSAWRKGDRELWHGGPAEALPNLPPHVFGFMPGMAARLRAFSPDVVHVHGLWRHASLVGARWAERGGGTLVVSPHGMLSADALACSPLKKRLAARLFQDRCFARTDVLHVTSDAEAQEARIYGLSMPICLFANGVGDAFGSPDWAAPRRNEIVTLGRKHHMKGLDTLLRAWAHVEPLASDWSLKIAGPDEGGYEHTLRELADRLRLRRVSFLPALYGERKRRFLTEAKLFILPSRSENFAMTVPEALLCGTPVISTRGAPWSGLNENGCGWWVDREETALAAAIQSATISIGNRQRRAMGEAGRAWILKDFTWRRVAERAETCYLQAQERHRWPS